MADSSDQLVPGSGAVQWVIQMGIAVAVGVGSALGLSRRLAKLEDRVTELETAKTGSTLRDELVAKVKEIAADKAKEIAAEIRREIEELRRELTERPAETLSSTVQGLVDARIGVAVTKAVAEASEKHLERLMALSDRVSSISGEIKSALTSGGKR